MKYTFEQFEIDFENAPDERKYDVLLKALDEIEMTEDVKNKLQDYREELREVQFQMRTDEDVRTNLEIDNGEFVLYKCIKEVPEDTYIVGEHYYAKIVDVRGGYLEKIPEDRTELLDYVMDIKPLIWVVRDNGIGTLKRRSVFLSHSFNFDDYFEK